MNKSLDKKAIQKERKNKKSSHFVKKDRHRFVSFKDSFHKEESIENKIALAICFMREILSQPDCMDLKDFWDAKRLSAPLFKQSIHPIKRRALWIEYAELNAEAVRLKALFDEQVAFTIEQIELAISALESDSKRIEELLALSPPLSLPSKLPIKQAEYEREEKEIGLLKTLSSRLEALRQEVIQIEMRISQKNRLLKRLSIIGDLLFPRRKELVRKMSERFISDIEIFSQKELLSEKREWQSTYVIRERIKEFQAFAKKMNLSTRAFIKSRAILSSCWEKITEREKEKRKEEEKQSEKQRDHFIQLKGEIELFRKLGNGEKLLRKETILTKAMHIRKEIKKRILGREGRVLYLELNRVEEEVLAKIEELNAAAAEKEKRCAAEIKQSIVLLIKNEKKREVLSFQEEMDSLYESFQKLSLSFLERQLFERQFTTLRSLFLEKTVKKATTQEVWQEAHGEKKMLIRTIQSQIEVYRREMGGSSLDFAQAMAYRELYDSAKFHLESEIEALENLEKKLSESAS